MKTHIHAARALIDGEIITNICVEVSQGLISAITPNCSEPADRTISGTLIPGFVDIHCHGGGGFYFSDTDAANIEKVLSQLDGVPPSARSAHFICEVALVFPVGHELTESGKLFGFITPSPRGTAGFGYDPIFQPVGSELTLGELAHGEKDKISHRGIAMRAIAPRILEAL